MVYYRYYRGVERRRLVISKQQYIPIILSQRDIYKRICRLSLFCLIVVLVGGGVALLLQSLPATHAGGTSVIGSPSLPASTVNAIFTRLGSPMAGTGKVIVQASQKTKIDDAFALAVWWTETNDGAAGVGRAYRNPGGVRGSIGYPSALDGYTIYPSYSAAATYWFSMLRSRYVDRGLDTVYAISHPYVGTSTSPLWAAKVIKLMQTYRSEAPAPSVANSGSAVKKPASTISPYVVSMLRRYQQLSRGSTTAAASGNGEQAERMNVSSIAQRPVWAEPVLLFLALLAVLAVAALALRLRRVPISLRTTAPLLPAMPIISVIDHTSSNELVQTGPLVAWGSLYKDPYSIESSSTTDRDTDAPIRRVVLLPSQPGVVSNRTTETLSPHSAGLLTRYKREQMALSHAQPD